MRFLNLHPDEKTALLIDGANLYKASRNLGFDVDYKRLLTMTRDHCRLVRAYYFTAIQEDRDQDYSPLRPLVDWLDYNGYTMVTKLAREYSDAQGKKRFRGSTDIELCVEMLSLAQYLDHIVLFAGNGDFRRAIEAVQAKAVRVTVVATVKSIPPTASDELRRQADSFIDLVDLEKIIARTGVGARKSRHSGDRTSDESSDESNDEYEDDYEDYDED